MTDKRVPMIASASTKGGVRDTLALVIATAIARWLSPRAEPGGGGAANVEALVDAVAVIVGLELRREVAA
jgi:hypothetical protein